MSASPTRVPRIVVSGGPCGGKTTALAQIIAWTQERGYQPILVHEAATQIINAGFSPKSPFFQRTILEKSLADETIAHTAIGRYGYTKPLLILDRGIPDQMGYMTAEEYVRMLTDYNLDPDTVREERYDDTIFMRSAAVGAPEFYGTANNAARYETLEEAQALDERTLNAWHGAKHLHVIANRAGESFDSKVSRAIAALARALGIPEPLERERKYRIDAFDQTSIPKSAVRVEIIQTYLLSRKGIAERVRARGGNGGWVFTHTIKEPYASGASIERERIISRREYDDLLVRRDITKLPIQKDRWCFTHGEHYCELDIFHGHQAGKVLLEIEHDEHEEILLPTFLGPLTDVTDDPEWSNYRMAIAA